MADMRELTRQHQRYGCRLIAALVRDAGRKRVERLWQREGLNAPMKQPKRGRLWPNEGSSVRLRSERRSHVWSYNFVNCRTDDGKVLRALNVIDEHSRECLAIRVDSKLNSDSVIDARSDLFILRGVPSFVQIAALSLLLRPCRIGSELPAQSTGPRLIAAFLCHGPGHSIVP